MEQLTATGLSSDSNYTSRVLGIDEIDELWPWLEPLVLRGLERSHCEEMTSADVFGFLRAGLVFAFVTLRDDEVEMMMLVEQVTYPRMRAVRVLMLVGKNLKAAVRFLPAFEDWALTIGATAIEGMATEAAYRLYRRRKLGFLPVYWVIRKNLKGKLQ